MLTHLAILVKHYSGALLRISGGVVRLRLAQDDTDLKKLDKNSRIPLLIISIYQHRGIVALLQPGLPRFL